MAGHHRGDAGAGVGCERDRVSALCPACGEREPAPVLCTRCTERARDHLDRIGKAIDGNFVRPCALGQLRNGLAHRFIAGGENMIAQLIKCEELIFIHHA